MRFAWCGTKFVYHQPINALERSVAQLRLEEDRRIMKHRIATASRSELRIRKTVSSLWTVDCADAKRQANGRMPRVNRKVHSSIGMFPQSIIISPFLGVQHTHIHRILAWPSSVANYLYSSAVFNELHRSLVLGHRTWNVPNLQQFNNPTVLHNLNLLWFQQRQRFSAVETKEGRNYLFKNTSRVFPSTMDHGVCDINLVDLCLPIVKVFLCMKFSIHSFRGGKIAQCIVHRNLV